MTLVKDTAIFAAKPNGTTATNGKLTTGAAIQTPPVKIPTANGATIAPKMEAIPKTKDEETILPLEDRILKIQILGDLISKREKLLESLKKINSYKFSSENRFDKLLIEDEAGNEFSTTNTEVLSDVIACIKGTINRKLTEVNAKIVF